MTGLHTNTVTNQSLGSAQWPGFFPPTYQRGGLNPHCPKSEDCPMYDEGTLICRILIPGVQGVLVAHLYVG